jgi:DNA-binding PadR family transcriptional regulator
MASGTSPALLGLLTLKPMTGYELKSAIQSGIGNFWSESFGQIYPELHKLTKQGLVTASTESEQGAKARTRYAITDAGRKVLRKWLSEPPKIRPPRSELLLKIFFAHEGDLSDLVAHLEAAREMYRANLKLLEGKEQELRGKYQGHPSLPFWLITLDNGKRSYLASAEWAESAIAQIKDQQTSTLSAS